MVGPLGNQLIILNLNVSLYKHWDSQETKLTVSLKTGLISNPPTGNEPKTSKMQINIFKNAVTHVIFEHWHNAT